MEQFDLKLFIKALGLAFAIEGMIWAGFPKAMRDAARLAADMPASSLRIFGLIAFVVGIVVCSLGF